MALIGPYGQFNMVLSWLLFSAICMRSSNRKSYFPLRAVLSVAGCLLLNALLDYIGNSIVFYYILLITVFVCLCFCFQNTIWQTLLVMGVAYALQYIMYAAWVLLKFILFPEFDFLERNVWVYVLYFVVLAVMLVLTWFITRDFKRLAELDKFYPRVVVIFLVVVFVTGFLCNQINHLGYPDAALIARLLSCIICGLAVWVAVDILVSQKIKLENTMQQYIIERQKQEFELRKTTIDDLNIKCHDLKYQIREIYSRAAKSDVSGLEEIENCITAFQNNYSTGNDALNVVLSEKARICTEKGISFNFMGSGELISFMIDIDIYRLFNNAIDNAIEALEKVEKEKRIIGVIIGYAGPFISVRFENYYDGQLAFAEGLPLTSKDNKLNHGFGVKSIKSIADSYNGQLSIEHDHETFALTLLFPAPKN